jgi:hypothetical protein
MNFIINYSPPLSKGPINRVKSAVVFSHNGLGDNVVMNGAIHFLTEYYDTIYFICKKVHYEHINFLYNDYPNIVVVPFIFPPEFMSQYECLNCKKIIDQHFTHSDVFICGYHKKYLESRVTQPHLLRIRENMQKKLSEYPSYNRDKIIYDGPLNVPHFYWFIEMFYCDIGIPVSVFFDRFKYPSDNSIIKLYNNISQFKIIFLHTSSSSKNNYIDISSCKNTYLNDDDYLFVCCNQNFYDPVHPKFSLANQYINLPTIFHYIEVIKNAAIIYLTDSCISCMVLPLIRSGEIKTRDIHIFNRETNEEIDISSLFYNQNLLHL